LAECAARKFVSDFYAQSNATILQAANSGFGSKADPRKKRVKP
jgi:hypothetical protein